MNNRIEKIRENERKSHTEIYNNEELYNSNSWLHKPIKTIIELSKYFENYDEINILDLGCGVGRNSIYLAEKFKDKKCIVECVDILDIAIEKLLLNAKKHEVDINGYVKSIEEYEIKKNNYDFIMAISALEHVNTEESFINKLREIKEGLKENGIVCLIINSNVKEINIETNEEVEAQFEINLPTENIQNMIDGVFSNFEVIKKSVVKQEYDIPRDGFVSHMNSNVVTFVGKK